ncbi:Uncharacterised protein [Mycobacteroides abscessus subsp. abscessus]|nr:Uncharacterised protein [Mycobacteroides abscessus subsp. abscessus]
MKVLRSTSVSRISCSVIVDENIARRKAGRVTCAIACCRSTTRPVSAQHAHRSTRRTNSSAITSATRARCRRPNIGISIRRRCRNLSPSSIGIAAPITPIAAWPGPIMLYLPTGSSITWLA